MNERRALQTPANQRPTRLSAIGRALVSRPARQRAIVARNLVGPALWLGLMVVFTGCSQFRLPAIDPTGESIFLPSPYGTTLVNPCPDVLNAPDCLEPAWSAPDLPPPCPEPGPMPPIAVAPPVVAQPAPARTKHPHLDKLKHHHEQLGQLSVHPTNVIAPVGGEVVLLAGLCDTNGLLVKNTPIRWLLTNDSVGHFVEVGDAERSQLHFLDRGEGKFHNGNHAEGRTTVRRVSITRGTPNVLDDIHVLEGQAWISLTSPLEGISYVSVMAPEADIWSERRQTAKIHWIDAQWTFPPPGVVQAGATAELVTVVTRTNGEAPPPNWMVRYELSGDSPAQFPGGQTSVDVPVDGGGRATATLVSPPGQPGVSQIKVQIVRGSEDGSRLVVAENWTSVTWSAPALDIVIAGPNAGGVGAALTYRATVSNPGDIPVGDAVASVELPNGMKYVSSSPTAQVFGTRVEWRLGGIPARGRVDLQLNLRADFAQTYRIAARAQAEGGLVADTSIDTQIFEPALDVRMEGPETAVVGDRIQYRVTIANTGDYPLANVVLRDRFDEGLQHAEGRPSPIEWTLGPLQPREERNVAVSFVVRQPGRWCHVLEVASNSQTKTVQACVVASNPQALAPKIEVRAGGPNRAQVGERVRLTVDVVNIGDTVVSNLEIVDVLDAPFAPLEATPGFDMEQLPQGRLVWFVRQLAPGQRTALVIDCQCTQAAAAAKQSVTVTADPGVSETASGSTEIVVAAPSGSAAGGATGAPSAPRPTPSPSPSGAGGAPSNGSSSGAGAPGLPPASGRLEVSVADLTDPATAGEAVTYEIYLRNNRTVEDRNVRLRIVLPPGMRFQKISRDPLGPADAVPLQPRFSPDGQTIDLPEVLSVRAGERLPKITLIAIPQQAGKFTVRAEATSLRSSEPAVATQETTAYAR